MFRRANVLLLLLVATGCNRADNAADRHAAEMRDAINKIQADTDRIDQRLGMLEVQVTEEKQARADETPAARSAAGPATQPARVVQLGGPAEPDNDDPNSPEARPEIRLTGQPGAYRPVRGKARPDEGGITDSAPAPRSSALDPEAKKAYEAGLAAVQGRQFAKGNEQLAAFLVKWPDHPYAENATYWRGEAFFGQGEYLRAAEQFEAVLTRFGAGKKAPDSLLKLGMCHDKLGNAARAQEYWDRLKNEFPASDAAKRLPTKSDRSRPEKGPKEIR